MKKPGRKTTVKVGSQILSANVYSEDRSGLLKEVQYGNGGRVKYAYDGFDRLTGVSYDGVSAPRYTYEYDASGRTSVAKDRALNCVFQTECDLSNRPMSTQLRNEDGSLIYRTMLNYDKQNRLIGFGESAGNGTYKTSYAYDNDNRVTEITYDGDAHKVKYTYDNLGRIASRTAECGADAGKVVSSYTYVAGGHGTGSTTSLVAKITQPKISFEYSYDSRGNIISEKRDGVETTYAYDALGQLIRVNDPHENATWVYNYDRGGNITSKVKYAYTTGALGTAQQTIPYVYGDINWKDKLTVYNGKTITYDAIGNPLNDGTWTYTWQAGRQLKQMTKSGTTIQYEYDYDGLRTQKIVTTNGTTAATRYTYNGKNLVHVIGNNDHLHIFYDTQNRPAKVSYNGVLYTYIHNLQGDIVGILDGSGALVVEYKYDAWGKPISTTGALADTLGKRNPFRYRGYVFDEETELYYLRNRYYSPKLGRFILPDLAIADGLCNLFTYTNNVLINKADTNGLKTYAVGCQTTGIIGCISVSIAKGICWDDLGNIGTFTSYAGLEGDLLVSDLPEDFSTVTMGLGSLSVTDFWQTTNLESIEDLNGIASSIGGSITLGAGFGYDVLLDKPASDMTGNIIGAQSSMGIGMGLDFVHISNTYTLVTVIKRNSQSLSGFGGAHRAVTTNTSNCCTKGSGAGRKALSTNYCIKGSGAGRKTLANTSAKRNMCSRFRPIAMS